MTQGEATSVTRVDATGDPDTLTVAVTGIGGLLGRRVAHRLLGNDRVERIVGLDVAAPTDLPDDPRLDLRQVDIRDARLADQFEGVDVVVHLAFILNPIRDETRMRAVNVDGTRNVFEAAASAGVRKVVYTSSYVVYGGHPDNDFPLTEDSALRANPDFNYAEHKYEIECWLWPWLEEHPELEATVFRPAIVVGRQVDNVVTRQMELPRLPVVKGYRPPWQFVHVDDVAGAIDLAVADDLVGAYNLAAEGWLSFDEALELSGKHALELPETVAFETIERLWRTGLGEAPPGELHYFMHPCVMSVDRLVDAGWRPRYSNREALAELVEEHAGYVNLLVVRTTTRRAGITAGAVVLGLLAAIVGWLRVRDVTGTGRHDPV